MSNGHVPLLGVCLMGAAVAEVFLTVFYAHGGVGLISPVLTQEVWHLFRGTARLIPSSHAARVLSLTVATLLVALVLTWVALLAVGFALIVWPALGTEVLASQGPPPPTSFWAALYYNGYSLTTMGKGDLVPKTSFYHVLTILGAIVGFSVLTLMLTYLMSVYSALIQRNALALLLHHVSGSNGDAAQLVARLGPGGDFGSARPEVTTIATEVLSLLEAHHSYPILHYFRRQEPTYAMARIALMVLDAASLACSALDTERHRSFIRSASVEALWGGGLRLLTDTRGFVPRLAPQDEHKEDRALRDDERRWCMRFAAAAQQFQNKGVAPVGSGEAGTDEYVTLRWQWNSDVRGWPTTWPRTEPRLHRTRHTWCSWTGPQGHTVPGSTAWLPSRRRGERRVTCQKPRTLSF